MILFRNWYGWGGAAVMAVTSLGLVGESLWAQPLNTATVDRIRNQVTLTVVGGNPRAAQAQDVLRPQDQLTTGQGSQAQLVFDDRSLMRLGQNSVFQFASDRREFILNRGVGMSITPKGVGGRVVTPAAVAAVQGSMVLTVVRPKNAGQTSPEDQVTFFAFSSEIDLRDPNDQPLGTIPVGQVGTVQDGQFLGAVPFDVLGTLAQSPILRGLNEPDPEDSPLAQEILASEKEIIEVVIPDLTPPEGDFSDSPNPNDIIRDPLQLEPGQRDIIIIID
ncbi:MAG: hypothetical protein OHK0012_26100 [Synechococcales cyanobacterium]